MLMDNPWREIEANWQGESVFIGSNPRGGTVQMGNREGSPGISPMELLLVGVAGCTGMDVASILTKKRQPLVELKVKVRGRMVDDFPRVFDMIEIEYLLWGDGIEPAAVEQAILLSEDKYCSASAMLRASAKVNWSYRILKPGEPT
jgi:putative redox protein